MGPGAAGPLGAARRRELRGATAAAAAARLDPPPGWIRSAARGIPPPRG